MEVLSTATHISDSMHSTNYSGPVVEDLFDAHAQQELTRLESMNGLFCSTICHGGCLVGLVLMESMLN